MVVCVCVCMDSQWLMMYGGMQLDIYHACNNYPLCFVSLFLIITVICVVSLIIILHLSLSLLSALV